MPLLDETDPVTTIDETKDYFAELVGEGRKFADQQALARSKVESDAFIERLQNEMKGLRNELKSRVDSETAANRLAELVDRLSRSETPATPSPTPDSRPQDDEYKLTPEKIEELLERKLTTMTAAQRAEANVNKVKQELQKKFGPGYAQHVRSQADALGMSVQGLEKLAAEAPEAFLRLVSGTPQSQQRPPEQPSSSITGFTPSVDSKRNEAFYNQLRQKDPTLYWSAKTQNQMHKDALQMGEAFFS